LIGFPFPGPVFAVVAGDDSAVTDLLGRKVAR
jgi:hypothetical protein